MAAPPDEDAVLRLMETTGADATQARFLLEAANGNFDAAAHMYFGARARAAGPSLLPVRHVVHAAGRWGCPGPVLSG
jgi:hypothetical protein